MRNPITVVREFFADVRIIKAGVLQVMTDLSDLQDAAAANLAQQKINEATELQAVALLNKVTTDLEAIAAQGGASPGQLQSITAQIKAATLDLVTTNKEQADAITADSARDTAVTGAAPASSPAP